MSDVETAIIGAGIAGMSTALACSSLGLNATVFEAAPQLEPLGTSLSLWPNAMACLAKWGVADAVDALGAPINRVAWRGLDGRAYFNVALDPVYSDLGHRGICVRRSDLHDTLSRNLPNGCLRVGYRLTSFERQSNGVALVFDNGTRLLARHVIAADGAHSAIRSKLLPDRPPAYAGYGAYLGLSKAAHPRKGQGEGVEYIGQDARIGIFETGNDMRYWFVVAKSRNPQQAARPANIVEVLAHMPAWPSKIRSLVGSSLQESVVHVSFYQREAKGDWGQGPICLIGDAMHPFVPSLGQGACQAIEDADVLAEGLARGIDPNALPRWMRQKRSKRVRALQSQAARIGDLLHKTQGLHRWVLPAYRVAPNMGMLERNFRQQFARSSA